MNIRNDLQFINSPEEFYGAPFQSRKAYLVLRNFTQAKLAKRFRTTAVNIHYALTDRNNLLLKKIAKGLFREVKKQDNN
jgi:hypothetical protein